MTSLYATAMLHVSIVFKMFRDILRCYNKISFILLWLDNKSPRRATESPRRGEISGRRGEIKIRDSEITTRRGEITFILRGDLVSQRGDLLSRHGEIVSQRGDLLSRHGEIVSRRGDLMSRHSEIVVRIKQPRSVIKYITLFHCSDIVSRWWGEGVVKITHTLYFKFRLIDSTHIVSCRVVSCHSSKSSPKPHTSLLHASHIPKTFPEAG